MNALLDGTKEFTEGFLDHVTVLVGIAIGKDAIGGVIHQPFWNYQNKDKVLGRTFYGVVGAGKKLLKLQELKCYN